MSMPGIISGRAWLSARRTFLQGELAKNPSAEQRAAIEAALAALKPELSASRHRWWRRLRWGSGPPG